MQKKRISICKLSILVEDFRKQAPKTSNFLKSRKTKTIMTRNLILDDEPNWYVDRTQSGRSWGNSETHLGFRPLPTTPLARSASGALGALEAWRTKAPRRRWHECYRSLFKLFSVSFFKMLKRRLHLEVTIRSEVAWSCVFRGPLGIQSIFMFFLIGFSCLFVWFYVWVFRSKDLI
jgi:hypothetical protein